MTEIKNYENYTINEDGVVINTKTGREMKPRIDKDGYYQLGLYKDGKQKFLRIHRLIALTFIPNPENKPQIGHINGNRLDNRLENLKWATISENRRKRSSINNNGKLFIFKIINKNMEQRFRYRFEIQRPELKHSYSNNELQVVIEYRNKFCAENNIEINDS